MVKDDVQRGFRIGITCKEDEYINIFTIKLPKIIKDLQKMKNRLRQKNLLVKRGHLMMQKMAKENSSAKTCLLDEKEEQQKKRGCSKSSIPFLFTLIICFSLFSRFSLTFFSSFQLPTELYQSTGRPHVKSFNGSTPSSS